MVKFEWSDDVFADLQEEIEVPRPGPPPRPSVQCLCGRFARYVGVRHGYNGSFSTETMTVECSRCGTVTIELV